MRERIIRFWQEKSWRKMKKSDWLVLALVGALLLILAVPTGDAEEKSSITEEKASQTIVSDEKTNIAAGDEDGTGESYTKEMEARLCEILSSMEGVGKVEVMITVEDGGECVVEKDTKSTVSTTTESDSSGGTRTVTQGEETEETRYVEQSGEQSPYITKEKVPTVTGVVVVAQGAGSPTVVSNISKAVEALFPVEAHKIMVVKMSSKEDGK